MGISEDDSQGMQPSMILQDTIFNDQWKCTCKRHRRYSAPPNASDLGHFTTKIFVWRQKDPAPLILDRDDQSDVVLPPGLEELFSIEADLGALSGSLQQGLNQSTGEPYWTLYFSVDLVFKNMRLMARVRWDEKVNTHVPDLYYGLTLDDQ
ncbi:hypothetical protein FRC17_001371 [Serendipita sp. 399]|nr:hypothetical protein FRC17_001371 [Serendipita sp. 399]